MVCRTANTRSSRVGVNGAGRRQAVEDLGDRFGGFGATCICSHSFDNRTSYENAGKRCKANVKKAAHRHQLTNKACEETKGVDSCRNLRRASTHLSGPLLAALGHMANRPGGKGSIEILSDPVRDEVEGIHEYWLLSVSVVRYITFCRIRARMSPVVESYLQRFDGRLPVQGLRPPWLAGLVDSPHRTGAATLAVPAIPNSLMARTATQ